MRVFDKVPLASYKGVLISVPNQVVGALAGNVIPAKVDWADYSDGSIDARGLAFNCQIGNSQTSIVRIASVYIDNTGNASSAYVKFPDTQYTIAVPPNAAAWYQAFTNGQQAILYSLQLKTIVPLIYLLFSGVPVNSILLPESQNVSPQLVASPNGSVQNPGVTNGLVHPAAGDNLFQASVNLTNGNSQALFPADATLSSYTMTHIFVQLSNAFNNGGHSLTDISIADDDGNRWITINAGVAGIGDPPIFIVNAYAIPVFWLQGIQQKFRANTTWHIANNVVISSGIAQVYAAYTKELK